MPTTQISTDQIVISGKAPKYVADVGTTPVIAATDDDDRFGHSSNTIVVPNDGRTILHVKNAASDRVKYRTITMDSAAMRTLEATPVDLIPTKAGHRYMLLGVHLDKAADAYGAGADVTLNYKDTGNTLAATIPAAQFTASGAVRDFWGTLPARTGEVTDQAVPAGGIDVNVGTAFTGNGGNVTITALYVELDDKAEAVAVPGAGATKLTFQTPGSVGGNAVADREVSVEVEGDMFIGPFPRSVYGADDLKFTVSSVENVLVTALRV